MNKAGRGLGRGLDALFNKNSQEEEQGAVNQIPIHKIQPNKFQPRRVFDETALEELASSIGQYGVVQPIVVRRSGDGYELVAGERRWRASKLAKLKEIPAIVKEYNDADMLEIALIENIQRENLNAIEEAQAYKRLMTELSLTQDEVAKKVGRSRPLVANMLRLLNLPPELQEYVSRGTLSVGQARPLLSLPLPADQVQAAELIIAEDLSVRDVEELVKKMLEAPSAEMVAVPENNKADEKNVFVEEAEDRLKLLLGTQVKIKPGKLKSKIEIEYYSNDDLERIMEVVGNSERNSAPKIRGPFVV